MQLSLIKTDFSDKELSEKDSSEERRTSVDGLSIRVSSGLLRKRLSTFNMDNRRKAHCFWISLEASKRKFSEIDSFDRTSFEVSRVAILDKLDKNSFSTENLVILA